MLGKLRSRVTYANVVASLALFVALGGTGYAVSQLSGKDIKKGSIPGNRLKKNGVSGKQINESKLGQVPSAADSASLGGDPASAFPRYGKTIPTGVTVTGVFGVYEVEQDSGVAANAYGLDAVSLPAPAPTALTDATVNFDSSNPTLTTDEDPSCSGSANAPTAPAGKVCLYPTTVFAANNTVTGTALDGSRFGFAVRAISNTTTASAPSVQVQGSWAYTAP